MRRRRLPSRRGGTSLVKRESTTDFRYLEQVVSIQFPIMGAREYLQRNMGNRVSYRLVEAERGEAVGIVRAVEIQHDNSGERTVIHGQRVLANGQPASFFVPDHLIHIEAKVSGAAAYSKSLNRDDVIILHVPVRGYLRFLPAIFHGEGPVESREVTRVRDTALQKWGGGLPEEAHRVIEVDEDPIRRFLFMFQHMMTTVTDKIDAIVDLTDPMGCQPKFLPWLASWVGFELDEALPIQQQRELVRRAIRLYRTRGTRGGIEEMVRVLTSAPVRVRERAKAQSAVLGKMHLIGGRDVVERYQRDDPPGCYLMEPSKRRETSFFTLVLEPRERFKNRFGERAAPVLRRIVQVVSQERPTHVVFTIEFDARRRSSGADPMSFEHQLKRVNPFEGLCLTASDILDEQMYHRQNLQRHSLFMHGHGVVQGLQVELEQKKKQYLAIVKSGYGITMEGQGVHLRHDVAVPLEVPKTDGEYMLWLFHVERPDAESERPVFDTNEMREARIIEASAPRLHPIEQDHNDGVALCRINVRLGRMVQVQLPVPRAGRRERAAESYLKPRVLDFIRLSKKIMNNLFRTQIMNELSIGAFGFYSSLVSAEFLMIEEGTTDRVLYRTAGGLINYGHDFFNPLPRTTDRIAQYTEFIRRVHAEVPGADQSTDTWLRWFQQFERLLQPLQRISDELETTVEAMR